MDWQGHSLLGLRAAQGLPEWEIEHLSRNFHGAFPSASYMPEIHCMREFLGAYCLILDWVYQEEFAPYARQANGKWVPHTPAGEDFASALHGRLSYSANVQLLEEMLNGMIRELQAGNMLEAICRAGVLGHFVQEPFTPGHAIDNGLFQELFPDPDPTRSIKLHESFDCAGGDFPPPEPVLLGCTVKEAANNLFAEIFKGMKKGMQYISPVIESTYRGDCDEVRRQLLMPQSQGAAQVTVSAWHTAFSIAFGRFDDQDLNRLKQRSLLDFLPYDSHLNIFHNFNSNYLRDENNRKAPMYARTLNEDGTSGEILIGQGFQLYGHAAVKFYLNGVYDRFRCGLAMPSRILKGQTEHTLLDFSIETDDRENLIYSEDICYDGTRIYSEELKAGTALHWIEADVTGAVSLIISSRATPWKNSDGLMVFSVPLLIIAEPVLIRKQTGK